MTTMNPGVTGRGLDIEPLVVRPNKAMRLESYRDGAARKITMESIRRRIQRKLRESQQTAA
jgi:hypothetical protein